MGNRQRARRRRVDTKDRCRGRSRPDAGTRGAGKGCVTRRKRARRKVPSSVRDGTNRPTRAPRGLCSRPIWVGSAGGGQEAVRGSQVQPTFRLASRLRIRGGLWTGG